MPIALHMGKLLFVDVNLLGGLGLVSLCYLELTLLSLPSYGLVFLLELVEFPYQTLHLLLYLN